MSTLFFQKDITQKVKSVSNGFAVNHITTLKDFSKVVSVATDKKSINGSEKLNEFLSGVIDTLPTEALTSKYITQVKKVSDLFKALKNDIEEFIEPLVKFMSIDVVLNDKEVCVVIDNLKKCILKCEFIVEYLNAIVEVYNNKIELKTKKAITFEELDLILKAA